jgi:hypothetical protein
MEMSVDRDDFEIIDADDFTLDENNKIRTCPRCSALVQGRRNKIYCSPNCRKRHKEIKRNSFSSVSKRRENTEFFEKAKRLAEQYYNIPPGQRLGYLKNLIDLARSGEDMKLRDILSNYKLLHPHPVDDKHLFHRENRANGTIAQEASKYCKRLWKADVKEVVYGKAPEPPTGLVK